MRTFVWWFLAPVEDAAAIRSIATTQARKREEWPHLALPGVDGPDMNQVEKVARPKRPKGSSKIGGELLDRSKLTATPFSVVSRISPEFVQILTTLDESGIAALGRGWAGVIDGVTEETTIQLVRQMAEFARRSGETGQPVLELVVM